MNRFPFIGALLLIPALALVFLTGCPAPKKDDKAKTDDGKKDTPVTAKVALKGAQDAMLKGVVKISGDRPEIKKEVGIDKFNNEQEKAECIKGGEVNPANVHEQTWIIGKDGGVANVVIWLEPGAGKKYADVKAETKAMFKKPADLDQPYCQYVPHVVAVYGDVQPLLIKNSSAISHNVKIAETKKNEPGNDPMGPKQAPIERKFHPDSGPINVQCSIHSWMNAKIFAFDHPYFAVTKDDGSFEIHNIPSGEDLVLYVWHESMSTKTKAKDAYKLEKGDNTYSPSISAKGEIK